MREDITSLRRQLDQAEQNLCIIRDRKAEYVLAEHIPLQLIKNERALEARIADLQRRMAALDPQSSLTAEVPPAADGAIAAGNVTGQGIAIGHGARAEVHHHYYGPTPPADPPPPDPPVAPAPNPFGRRGRIDHPADFFGREELLRRIFEELGKGSNLALIGERQIGKSSLLCMIQCQGAARLGLPAEALLQIDMQIVHSEADFFEALCVELGLAEPCRGYRLARLLRGRRHILCLDEIEKMRRDRFSADVRDELRGLADGTNAPLTLVVASSLPLAELFPDTHGGTSPLANICSPLDVPPFTRTEARAFLVTRLAGTGVQFSDDEIADLLETSGRHPGRLQQVAEELYRQKTKLRN